MTITAMVRSGSRDIIGRSSHTTALTAEETNRQYHAEAANWELPAGWEWPERPFPDVAPDSERVRYGPGIGPQDALRYWKIAWYDTLSGSASAAERDVALQQLARLPQVWKRPEVQAARAGDLAGVRRFLKANGPKHGL